MEKQDTEHYSWALQEQGEEEGNESDLKGRQPRQHSKNNVVSSEVIPSSSSVSSNASWHSDLMGTNPDELHIQKEGKDLERSNISDNFNDDEVHNTTEGLAIAAEFAGATINEDAVTSSGTTIASALPNQNRAYIDSEEGSEANREPSGVQNDVSVGSDLSINAGKANFNIQVESSDIHNILWNEVNNQCMKTMKDRGHSNFELSPLQNTSEVKATTLKHINGETSTRGGTDLIEEIDQRLKEFDVEAVLAKQETNDLFCPNCNSCITKRVILRKRKRNIHNLDPKLAKHDKYDDVVSSKVAGSLANEVTQGDNAITASDFGSVEHPADNPEKEPEVFRCLSCLNFFIPTGNGFNLFWNFGRAHQHEALQNPANMPGSNIQDPSNIPTSNANWFFSLFTSNKGKIAIEKGDPVVEYSNTGPEEQNYSPSIPSNILTSPEIDHSESSFADIYIIKNGSVGSDIVEENNNLVDADKTDTLANLASVSFSRDIQPKQERDSIPTPVSSEEPAKDDIWISRDVEPDVLAPSAVGSDILEKSWKDIDKIPNMALGDTLIGQNNDSSFMQGTLLKANDAATNIQSSGVDAKSTLKQDFTLFEKVKTDIREDLAFGNKRKGADVIISVEEEEVKSIPSQTHIAETVPIEETPTEVRIGEETGAEFGDHRRLEILKSIVYGGLIESITSLGLVSSAVSAGATPSNIVALGLANLIGGLFIIGHNLIELKNDNSGRDEQQMNIQQDRYQELLGRRANFALHLVVVILSFLIFGSVPLVIYGILISKNYYTEVKLAAVAATSLVCIILLATGKVYAKRQPKSYIKTVSYYVFLAITAAGVSYIAGGLIEDVLKKFSESESGFVIKIPFSSTGMMEASFMSS